LIVALVPGQQRSLDKLKAMRVQLSNEVADLINDFGPTLYEDFNEVRSLVNYNSSLAQAEIVAHSRSFCERTTVKWDPRSMA
jgi:hypothetical protein